MGFILLYFLIFLATENAPIIANLLLPKGLYDYKLATQEGAIKSWSEQQKAQRDIEAAIEKEINHKVYGDLADEQERYDFKRKRVNGATSHCFL
jgi:hypothetical protein